MLLGAETFVVVSLERCDVDECLPGLKRAGRGRTKELLEVRLTEVLAVERGVATELQIAYENDSMMKLGRIRTLAVVATEAVAMEDLRLDLNALGGVNGLGAH